MSRIDGAFVWNKTVTLTNAQVLNLPITAVEIVPAPAAGYALMMIGALASISKTAIYNSINADSYLNLAYGVHEASSYILNDSGDSITGLTSFLGTSPGTARCYMQSNLQTSLAFGAYALIEEAPGEGVAINLKCDNGGAPFGGGHASNSLTIFIFYAVIQL